MCLWYDPVETEQMQAQEEIHAFKVAWLYEGQLHAPIAFRCCTYKPGWNEDPSPPPTKEKLQVGKQLEEGGYHLFRNLDDAKECARHGANRVILPVLCKGENVVATGRGYSWTMPSIMVRRFYLDQVDYHKALKGE